MIRRTLAQPVTRTFTWLKVMKNTITLNPVHHPQGFLFKYKRNFVPALLGNVSNANNRIVLTHRNTSISMVEHLLAALVVCGITDAEIVVTSTIIPSLPKGMLQFVEFVREGGTKEITGRHPYFQAIAHDAYAEEDRIIELERSSELSTHCIIDFPEPVGTQEMIYTVGKDSPYEIASSRPFRELGKVTSHLIRPVMPLLDETFLFANPDGFINATHVNDQEPVIDKTVDFYGTVALLGQPVIARFNLCKPGLAINVSALKHFVNRGHLHLTNAR